MWSRRRENRWIEALLRSRRAEAPDDLVRHISAKVLPSHGSPRQAWSRAAFAGAVSVFILGTFASFGGVSYAGSGATGTYDAVKQIVVAHKLKVVVPMSAAVSQYPSTPKSKPSVFVPPKVHHHAPVLSGVVRVQGKTLPFTGLSLLGTLVASLALIGTGLILRRRERRS